MIFSGRNSENVFGKGRNRVCTNRATDGKGMQERHNCNWDFEICSRVGQKCHSKNYNKMFGGLINELYFGRIKVKSDIYILFLQCKQQSYYLIR